MAQKSEIRARHVSFTYPGATVPAISEVSFEIAANAWTALIGHNGSGKSTLSRLLNGLLLPDEKPHGQIWVSGQEVTPDTIWQIRNQVGIVFQNPDNQFVGATVADDVAFGLENRGVPRDEMIGRVAQAIDDVGMSAFKKEEPTHLSGGQKQRVAIAGILAIQPRVIILDEATSMLDPSGRDQILRLIKRVQKENHLTVLSITHDIEEASQADQILILNDGHLIGQGTPKQVFSQITLMRQIGLDIPFFYQLKSKLEQDGIEIPEDVDSEKKLVNYLWQLNSNM